MVCHLVTIYFPVTMAVRVDAAARSSSCKQLITYSRQDLFRIGLPSEQLVIDDFISVHGIPPDIAGQEEEAV